MKTKKTDLFILVDKLGTNESREAVTCFRTAGKNYSKYLS